MKLKTVIVLCLIILVLMTFSAGCSKGLVTALKSMKVGMHASEAYDNEELISDSQYLQYDYIQKYEIWGEKGVSFDISVKSSGNIDILILDVENYMKYTNGFENGINKPFRGSIYKNVNSKDFQYCLPETGTYYMIIENSKFVSGGADARRGVNIEVSVI